VQGDPRRQRAREVVLQVVEQFVAALAASPTAACPIPRRRSRRSSGQDWFLLITSASGRNWMIFSIVSQRWRASSAVEPGQFLGAEDLHLVRIDDVEVAGQRRPAGDGVDRLEHALPPPSAGQPAQAEPFLLLVEQVARR
jgi:hypothetical protein